MVLRFIFMASLALAAAMARVHAAPIASAETNYVRTEIFAEKTGFAPGEPLRLAIRQSVREGWHVFWVNPGDAGIALTLDWRLPDGFKAGGVVHPAPHYIPVGPLASYAHEGAPVFITEIIAPQSVRPGDQIDIALNAQWQVCEEICVPEGAQFEFSLPVEAAPSLRASARGVFDHAAKSQPEPFDGAAVFSRGGDDYLLRIDEWPARNAQDIFFFPAHEGLTKPAAVQRARIKNGALLLRLQPGWLERFDKDTVEGVIAYKSDGQARRALSLVARVDGPLVKTAGQARRINITGLLALAFFGGVLLNLMPCVFPIIFIKAASFMENAKNDRAAVRRHGLIFTAGVLTVFAAIGATLLALRAGGEQLGWGFHLQSPAVVALSAYILFLVGLNLFGFFTVGESLAGRGEALTRRGGFVGAFFTGALAVVVAAPCIGPLLSAPMGAALLAPAPVGMGIFLVLGLGLAAPYLVLSLTPAAARVLPHPGPWMAVLKQALAFPVFAAAAYFLWVFSQQTGTRGLGVLLAGAVALALAAWLFEKSKLVGARAIWLRGFSALIAAAAIFKVFTLSPAPAAGDQALSGYGPIETVAYDRERLADLRASRTPVFIDFTAAWCVTCQFNKMTVLKSDAVARAFGEAGAVMMVADWTVRDPEITAALAEFGAAGVPLYVVYAPGAQASILPLPLTAGAIARALNDQM